MMKRTCSTKMKPWTTILLDKHVNIWYNTNRKGYFLSEKVRYQDTLTEPRQLKLQAA